MRRPRSQARRGSGSAHRDWHGHAAVTHRNCESLSHSGHIEMERGCFRLGGLFFAWPGFGNLNQPESSCNDYDPATAEKVPAPGATCWPAGASRGGGGGGSH